jgi:hypothetical protein
MTDAALVIDLFREAAELNRTDSLRQGSLLEFPDYGQVVATGDMHGHRRNFEKLVKFCHLEKTPIRHVLLHELIHEEPAAHTTVDRSIELLTDAARWKAFFPNQVHFLQSNHELSQLHDHPISKGGRIVADDFDAGVAEAFGGDRIDEVLAAIDEFLASFPVAARSANRIFFAHSLPGPRDMASFDPKCIRAAHDKLDLTEGGHVYNLVWGRGHTPEVLDALGAAWNVDMFVVGHQPQEWGYEIRHDRLVILASDHNHGVFLPIDLKKKYTTADLESRIRKFVSVE